MYYLAPIAILELIGIGLIDNIEVILPMYIYIITERTYRPIYADIYSERPFS